MKYENHWLALPNEQQLKTSFVIERKIAAQLAGIHGKTGTLQTTVAILLTKLTHELESAGITNYDPTAYEHAIAGCCISLGGVQRSTASSGDARADNAQSGKATNRNVRRRTASLARQSSGAQESSNATGASSGGQY